MEYKDIVVVIPVHKAIQHEDEKDALARCCYVMKNYKIVFIAPEGLNFDTYKPILEQYDIELSVEYFSPEYFQSYRGYNQLCLSEELYYRFNKFQYMLIYHLDAWTFKDELLEWCKKGYDYIGAPLNPVFNRALNLADMKAGNGGFSLRKIDSMIKLTSFDLKNKKLDNYKSLKSVFYAKKKKKLISNIINIPVFLFYYVFQKFVNWKYMYNEDLIIAYYAQKYMPEFNIAPDEVSEKFSLEYNTLEKYYSKNFVMPFGCHNNYFYKFLICKQAIKGDK